MVLSCPAPRRGFTVVELLVVLGIITVLAGLVLPTALAARGHARAAQCAVNVRRVGDGLLATAVANRMRFPPNVNSPAPGRYWFDKKEAGLYLADGAAGPGWKPAGGVLACPADTGGIRSYAMNVWASAAVDRSVFGEVPGGKLWELGTVSLPAARMILVVEAVSITGSEATGWLARPTAGGSGWTAGQRFGGAGGVPLWTSRFGRVASELAYGRHPSARGGENPGTAGRLNIGYADGHVAMVTYADLVDAHGRSTGGSVWYPGEAP